MNYLEEVQKGMDLLASNPKTVFIGQAMEFKGHAVSRQVNKYPKEQLLEFPVAEEFQAGFSLGMALDGYLPICIYPRCNFAILACNQIVNHIDKWEVLTGQRLKILVKMCVGAKLPLDPDFQHKANYSKAFQFMCEFTEVRELIDINTVISAYNDFYYGDSSMIIIEHSELY